MHFVGFVIITVLQYFVCIAFPRQQCLRVRASELRYVCHQCDVTLGSINLQFVIFETRHKPFDFYRLSTVFGTLAGNTNICQGQTTELQIILTSFA
jgi:hypothetical protein